MTLLVTLTCDSTLLLEKFSFSGPVCIYIYNNHYKKEHSHQIRSLDVLHWIQWALGCTLRRDSSLSCLSSSKAEIQLYKDSWMLVEMKIYSWVSCYFWECVPLEQNFGGQPSAFYQRWPLAWIAQKIFFLKKKMHLGQGLRPPTSPGQAILPSDQNCLKKPVILSRSIPESYIHWKIMVLRWHCRRVCEAADIRGHLPAL